MLLHPLCRNYRYNLYTTRAPYLRVLYLTTWRRSNSREIFPSDFGFHARNGLIFYIGTIDIAFAPLALQTCGLYVWRLRRRTKLVGIFNRAMALMPDVAPFSPCRNVNPAFTPVSAWTCELGVRRFLNRFHHYGCHQILATGLWHRPRGTVPREIWTIYFLPRSLRGTRSVVSKKMGL